MTTSSRSSPPPSASSPGDADPPGAPGELDLRGEVCPFTFVRTKLALEGLPMGGTLSVVVDHEPAARNVPRSAKEWGQEVLGVTAVPGGWRIDLRRRVR